MSAFVVHEDDSLQVAESDRVLPRCTPAEEPLVPCLYATYRVEELVNYDNMWDESAGELIGHPLYRLLYTAYLTHLPLHLHPARFIELPQDMLAAAEDQQRVIRILSLPQPSGEFGEVQVRRRCSV